MKPEKQASDFTKYDGTNDIRENARSEIASDVPG